MTIQPPRQRNLRADCAWVLYQVLESGVSTRDCMPTVLAQFENARDKNWLNEAVMGVLRNLPLLQSQLRNMLQKPLKGNKKIVEHLLLVGFYQLRYMRVPSHAAINETVEATKVFSAQSLRGLVNGVLRSYQRELSEPLDQSISKTVLSGLPGWLYKAIDKAYPSSGDDIVDAMNTKPPMWLCVNTEKSTLDELIEAFEQQQIPFEKSANHPNALIVTSGDVTTFPGFDQGKFFVQDGAAQLAASMLNVQPNDKVLDCCAAPGGKTCHLYMRAPTSRLTALDIDAQRATRINENLSRLGAKAEVLVGDACKPERWWNGELYDRILLDAPCSATGVIRRHPDIRWLRKSTDINQLVALQARILESMWSLLKPGGTLVYATCSILPEENTQQIERFLATTPGALLDGSDRQILPGEEQMDGFYYARLLKLSEADA